MAENLQKRPTKGILKNSSSFDTQDHSSAKKAKETKWDEMNIIATLHPADKDYGHMKIDEPKTPYHTDADNIDGLNAAELAEKIRLVADNPPKALVEESESESEEDDDLTPEEKAKRKEFENRRKKHYNEFYAVKLARKLLEDDEEEEEEEEDNKEEENAACNVNPKNDSKEGCSK